MDGRGGQGESVGVEGGLEEGAEDGGQGAEGVFELDIE